MNWIRQIQEAAEENPREVARIVIGSVTLWVLGTTLVAMVFAL